MAYLPSKMTKTLKAAILVTRPPHWTKNLSIFAALIFSGLLYDKFFFLRAFWAFWAFSLAASATYIFNDIVDAPSDRLHPIKKGRPIAKGTLPVSIAIAETLFLAIIALLLSKALSDLLFILILSYLLIQLAYSLILKNVPVLDILIIATGFVIRIYAGAFVIDAHLSVWFLLCVISVALFLASGKRRAELGIVPGGETRKSLQKYPKDLLNSYVTMFGNASWMSWALFTFFESPKVPLNLWLFLAEFSRTTTINKLLMITIPVTIFGIMRYQALIFEGRSEAPEKLLLSDIPLVTSVIIWTMMVIWILYGSLTFSFLK